MLEEAGRPAGVFGSDQCHLAQHADRPERHILEVPYGSRDHIEDAGHERSPIVRMYSAEPLPHFVDEYLAYLYEVNPTNATFDGVHVHDDLLEDLSRQAIDAQVRSWVASPAASPRSTRPG